ncbi:MAG: DinB family protein [Phycisphaerales bacterium]
MVPIIDRMEAFPDTVRSSVGGLSDTDARWRPEDGAWSVCEVVWHLAEEEALDFPVRLRLTIASPGKAWPPIDPEGWARERAYNEKDLCEGLDLFAKRRRGHVDWLRALTPEDLARTYPHPQWGDVPAAVIFASWCAHDALHLRQIAGRLYQLVGRDAPGVDTRYAGEW